MNLNSNDYKSMICARADWVRAALYPNQFGNAPQAFNAPPPPEVVPDFERLKTLLTELTELTHDFEASLGPA